MRSKMEHLWKSDTSTGQVLLYSGKENEEDPHEAGVGIMLSKKASKSLIEWEPISDRIIKARLESRHQKTTIIQCYSPTNDATEDAKTSFYEELQSVVDRVPRRDILLLMGDLNAKVGVDNAGRGEAMGQQGIGQMNENGELLADFCIINRLVIGGTLFPHKQLHKPTWVSPDGRTTNQIDHIAISSRWRSSLLDVRAKRGADVASDHHLVIGEVKIKLSTRRQPRPTRWRYDVDKLKDGYNKQCFELALSNRYASLVEEEDEEHLGQREDETRESLTDRMWETVKTAYVETCEENVGRRASNRKPWMSAGTWQLIEEWRQLKDNLNRARTRAQKREVQKQYSQKDKEVKKSCKRDKREFAESLAQHAEEAASKGDSKTVYDITRRLSGKRRNTDRPIRNCNGAMLTRLDDQLKEWRNHFTTVLNRPPPVDPPPVQAAQPLNINTGPISIHEIKIALKNLKNGKAAGADNIPPEALKAGGQTSVNILHDLISHIWETETIPQEWRKGLLLKLPKKGNISYCENWRGITLLSTPSKVLSSIILARLKSNLDQIMREEQAGFRQERSCTDQIATLRIIIEQSIEFQSSLYLDFVDFGKAFDSVDHQVLWNLLGLYGVPDKVIRIIKLFYQDFSCQVIHSGSVTEPFTISTGVRQGCLLSPLLFLIVIDWVTKTAFNTSRGIRWTLTKRLEDLDFADDICMLAHRLQDAQEQLDHLRSTGLRAGLKINVSKTKTMRVNACLNNNIMLSGQAVEDVNEFTYLGSIVSPTGGTEEDIKARRKKAQQAFATLRPVWSCRSPRTKTKLRIFNSNVKSVLLYGSETWRETNALIKQVQVFINKCLRQILGIRWPEKNF